MQSDDHAFMERITVWCDIRSGVKQNYCLNLPHSLYEVAREMKKPWALAKTNFIRTFILHRPKALEAILNTIE
jgi:hypothetical protein